MTDGEKQNAEPEKKGSLDYGKAKTELARLFALAEADAAAKAPQSVPGAAKDAADTLFSSSVQSLREALLGCGLARLLDRSINIREPYVAQGQSAFNGRTLDEQVINPYLKDKQVPSSKGPYLASFRRQVRFDEKTGEGQRDKKAYAAMLAFISELEAATSAEEVEPLVRHLLLRFVELRDKSRVPLSRVNRLSLEQQGRLIRRLLETRSGGRFPVLLSVAMFVALKSRFALPWNIEWQGINSADAASGVGGDITIREQATGDFVFAVEVTERTISRERVVSTFSSKIAPNRIADYLFFYTAAAPEPDARTAAHQYFAQGHDISFLNVTAWLESCLGTIGPAGRAVFTDAFVDLLDEQDIPSDMKVRWNEFIHQIHEPPSAPHALARPSGEESDRGSGTGS